MHTGSSLAVSRRHSAKRYTKFVLVGICNAVVDLAVLNFLMLVIHDHSSFALVVDNSVAVSCAILNSYALNRKWTFADRTDGSPREGVLFLAQAVLNIGLNDWILAWCASYLVFSRDVPIFISSNISKALAMFLSSTVSYFFMRWIVFRGIRRV